MRLTHLMLAEMTASSRVGVSKAMARFRREGVIKKRDKSQIVLLDQPRLAQIARNR
jgi:CRP-like cAMP-binding protein